MKRPARLRAIAALMAAERTSYVQMLFNPFWSCPATKDAFYQFLKEMVGWHPDMFYLVDSSDPNKTIGFVNVQPESMDNQVKTAAITMYVSSAYKGRGVATRALGEILALLQERYPTLEQIEWHCYSTNVASQQVAIRNGFRLRETAKEGHLIFVKEPRFL